MKKNIILLSLFLSLISLTSCSPPVQPTNLVTQHADPFYNINHDDYPLLHLPLIKPLEAEREDGRTPWRILLTYGPWVRLPGKQTTTDYGYDIEELEKFAVINGIILAYSTYVDKEADAYIQDNYYHWFVIIPEKKISAGFHTENEFRQYIQTLGLQDPVWLTPDEAYKKFADSGGCLDWIPDCK